jgi:hypothetical protein
MAALLLMSVEWEVAPGDDEAQEEQAAQDEGKGDGCSPAATECGMRGSPWKSRQPVMRGRGMAALLLLLSVEWEVAPGDDEAQDEQAAYDEGEGGRLLSCCYSVWNER